MVAAIRVGGFFSPSWPADSLHPKFNPPFGVYLEPSSSHFPDWNAGPSPAGRRTRLRPEVKGTSQARGNSGILLMSRYEIQVLDAFRNPTYADGQAGAIYGQWPPLANPARPDGQWQAYDIVFEAPGFDGEKLVKPAFVTVFMNNVLMHNRKEMMGAMVNRKVATYAAHGAEEPLALQDHHDPVRYRNIWIRRLRNYDEPEK